MSGEPSFDASKIRKLYEQQKQIKQMIAGSRNGGNAPFPGARQAPDRNWYLSDPNRPGKYLRIIL